VRDRSTRLDGTRAAATSAGRNRAVLFNALQYAAELGLVDAAGSCTRHSGGYRR
jgi:hypothetical protein